MFSLKKILRKTGRISAVLGAGIVIFLIAVLALVWLDKPLIRKTLQRQIERRTGAKINIERLDYSFFPLKIRAHRTEITAEGDWGKAEAFVERLELDGHLRKLFQSAKPALGGLRIEGADIHIRLKSSEEKSGADSTLRRIFDSLNQAAEIKGRDVRAEILSQVSGVTFDIESFLVSNRGGNNYQLSFLGRDIGVKDKSGGLLWKGSVHAKGDVDYDGILRWSGKIESGPSRLALSRRTINVPEAELTATGSFSPRDNSLSMAPFEMDVPGWIKASGKLSSIIGPDFPLNLDLNLEMEDSARFMDLLRPSFPVELQKMAIHGHPVLKGKASLIIAPGGEPVFEGELTIGETHVSYPFHNAPIEAWASIQVAFRGMPLEARYSGNLRLVVDHGEEDGLRVDGLDVRLPFQGDLDSLNASSAVVKMKSLILTAGKVILDINNILMKTGPLSLDRKALDLSSFEADFPGLMACRGKARIGAGSGGVIGVSLESVKFDLSGIRSRILPLLPDSWTEWTIDGDVEMALEIKHASGEGPWLFSGKTHLSRAGFQNASSTAAGEGIAAGLIFDVVYEPLGNASPLSGSASLDLSRGEVLWKDLYIDWSQSPLSSEFSFSWNPTERKLGLLSSKFTLASVGAAESKGMITLQSPLSFHLDLKTGFDLDRLSAWLSSLRNTRPANTIEGLAEGRFIVLSTKGAMSVLGRMEIRNGRFEDEASGLAVAGIEASLPVWIGNGEEPMPGEKDSTAGAGVLRAAELRTPWLAIRPFNLDFSSERNLFLVQPFDLSLLGGRASVGTARIAVDPAGLGFKGLFSLNFDNIDLARLPAAPASPPIKGLFQADFPRIEMTPARITAAGEGHLDVFGGRVTVRNIAVLNPLSAGRTFRCDVEFGNIDLERLTDVVPFGRVTGTLRGEVKGLALSYGQPESFSLRLESVRKKGVRQKFSLRAVNNLSVISSGEKTSLVSSRWWLRFVSHFGYSKIGIASTLKNDMFTLRGTIFEKGVEYLVKKARWFGISVVNKMPDKTISFKDMAQRLKRVGESQMDKEGK